MTDGIGGIGDIPGIGGPGDTQSIESQPGSQQQQIEDQVQASDDIAALMYMMAAQSPSPYAPNSNNSTDPNLSLSKDEVLLIVAKRYNDLQSEVVQNILDSWLKQIEESAQRTREWLQSPGYQTWLESKFPNLNPQIIQQQMEIQNAIKNANIYSAEAIRSSAQAPNIPGELAAIALGGLLIGGGAIAMPVSTSVGVGMTGVGTGMGVVRSVVAKEALAAQLGYIGGFLLAGIGARSSINALFGGVASGKFDNVSLAREFSSRILNMVTQRGFEEHILNRIVSQLPKDVSLNENQMVATIKILMLANGIASLKKAEEGWIGPKMGELFLSGGKGLDLGDGSVLGKLYGEMATQLQRLSPQQREKIVGALEEYFETEPDVHALTDINSTYAAIALKAPMTEIAEK
jgi:hypothetical protein